MEHLWAPWRNNYVSADKKSSPHLFLEIAQSPNDEENLVLFRSKACYALLNRFPYNTGHLMVVPYREVIGLEELSDDEQLDLWKTVNRMTSVLKKTLNPQGFNIGINVGPAAGAGLPIHLHVHVVPRWGGDANFMTTVAETRIHPADLVQVYQLLKKAASEA